MKKLSLLIVSALSITAYSQDTICPTALEVNIAYISRLDSINHNWNAYITYTAGTMNTSVKWVCSTGDSGCITPTYGLATTVEVLSLVAGSTAPTVILTGMAGNCQTVCVNNISLALAPKIHYDKVNNLIHFEGLLRHRESGRKIISSPYKPEYIGQYYSVRGNTQSNTVYVNMVSRQTMWQEITLDGRVTRVFVLQPNMPIINQFDKRYRQIK